ncbi:MAG: hypothetical protein IMF10_07310, partial [Proteobacteria bacterium]|nr:hypothetical protein [Pseudomonadota bacterium]
MKKLVVACEILVLVLFVAKIVAVGGIIKETKTVLSVRPALAEAPATKTYRSRPRDVDRDALSEERALLASLLEREKQLNMREKFIESEEKRIALLKKGIVEKIEKLRALEEELTVLIETYKAADDKRYKELAKVYESTPPAKAGSMLEKLDK